MKQWTTRFCTLLPVLLLAAIFTDVLSLAAAAQSQPASDHVLTVYVSTSPEDGKIPLRNIILDIYKVASFQDSEKGQSTGITPMSAEEIAKYKIRDNLVGTLMTDEQGFAAFNFTQAGQPDGVYLITEQHNPAMAGEIKPFLITVKDNAVTLELEKVTEKAPNIQMDVAALQQKSGSYPIGENHSWIIRSDVPAGICNAQTYQITDILDYRLRYKKGSPVVTLIGRDGIEITLEEQLHYLLTEETLTSNGHTVDAFHISLTPEGMTYVAANGSSGKEKSELRVQFQAAIHTNTAMGATIPNDAHLDYVNSAGIIYHADSDIPEVHTGGIHILKTDEENIPLSGSDFMIAREATQAELEDETLEKEVLDVGGKNLAVVYVDFYSADLSGEKQFVATTGADGRAAIYGLSYGTYYLVETKASEGYEMITQTITVEINEASHLTEQDGWTGANGQPVDNTVKIINKKFIFPATGGMGSTGFTAVGVLLICAACLLILSNRNKRI